jgi:hypothetical protein
MCFFFIVIKKHKKIRPIAWNGFYLQFYARILKVNGGGRGIRTPARFDPPVGFQDRSLQPDLGIPPY